MPDIPRNRFIPSSFAAWALACLPVREALACPDCISARAVRASVLDDSFWTHLYRISLPLLVLGMISALLYRIGSNKGRP